MKKAARKMLLVSEVAARLGESQRNITNWANQHLFPGAERVESPRGPYWEIPEEDLACFKRPQRGRPPKKKEG